MTKINLNTSNIVLNPLLRMRQIDIHRHGNRHTSNRHGLRRQWKGKSQPNHEQIQYAKQGEKAIPMRQGA